MKPLILETMDGGLLQAAIEAGKRDVASDALSNWLDDQRGVMDAAVAIGGGGSVSSRQLEAMLQVWC